MNEHRETRLSFELRLASRLLELHRSSSDRDVTSLMRQCLDMIEEFTESTISSFHFVSAAGDPVYPAIFSSHTGNEHGETISENHNPFGLKDIWHKSANRKLAVVFNKPGDGEAPYEPVNGQVALDRFITVPIIESDAVAGQVTVGNKARPFSDSDLRVTEQIAEEAFKIAQSIISERTTGLFSRCLQHSLNEIYIFDSETLRFIDINRGGQQNLGYSSAELKSMTPLDIKPHFTRVSFDEIVEPLRTGSAESITYSAIHQRKDKTLYPVEINLQLLAEKPPVFVAMATDINERLRMESELRQLAQAVEQSPVSIVITNLDAEIEYINEEFVRVSGYSREELIGKNPRIKQSGNTPRESYTAMWNALKQGLPWKGELFNRRKDGTEIVEMALIAPLSLPDGQVTHYVGVLEDITEKKKLSEELTEHREHLEELVEIRTAQLLEAQQRAEAANQAKSAFLANMSHEIRTPINAIVGLTHLLEDSGLNETQIDRLSKIDASAALLLSIIDDILDLSKIEAGKLSLEQSNFHLQDIFEPIQSLLSDQAKAKGLVFELDYGDLPETVRGDPTRLRHALLNIVSNAIKFTDEGRISIACKVVKENPEGMLIRFKVQDSGIGIQPERLPSLFDVFEQADASTTRRYGGTGLGLAITRRLVELMDGEVGVSSEPGKGSTFWFTVRVGHVDEDVQAEAPREAVYNQKLLASEFGGSRILLVEDNETNREVALALLGAASLELDTAEDGREAIEKVSQSDYDLILMDIQMPEMDGLEATRLIRAMPDKANLPILAMTANVFSEDRKACVNVGMNDFVPKPVEPQQLYSTIARWLKWRDGLTDGMEPGFRPARDPWHATTQLPFNPDALQKVFGDDQSAQLDILRTFIDQTDKIIAAIDTACERQDAENISFHAHKLKSSARTVGADGLADLCYELEQAGREADWSEIHRITPELKPATQQVSDYVNLQ